MIPPASQAAAITPHDTNPISPIPNGIYVGGAGSITLRAVNSAADVVITAPPVGTILPIRAQFVRATGTTATLLVALR
jgi:hypothetical protein